MDKEDAQMKADYLIELMIKHQPQLFAPVTANGPRGADLAMALIELRQTLTAEFEKQ
jgi:hypothetical protein